MVSQENLRANILESSASMPSVSMLSTKQARLSQRVHASASVECVAASLAPTPPPLHKGGTGGAAFSGMNRALLAPYQIGV